MTTPSVSVLGLGIIGSIWAKHYAEAGFRVSTWNRTPKPQTAGWAESPLAAAEASDILHLCVYDPASVDEVLGRIGAALGEGKTVIQSSTIDPVSAERFAAQVRETGARYVEAPFTGSKPAADARKTVFFLGGESVDLETVESVLAVLSRKCFRFDSPQQAATIKLAMNHQISAITQALCEGVAWSRQAGLQDEQFFDVLRENVAWSGLAELKETKIRNSDFAPQFSVRNMEKDMRLASDSAPLDLPSLRLVRDRLGAALKAGYAEDDFISLLRLLS